MKNFQFGRIGVLMGGYSSEREISLKSGKGIFEALKGCGCNVIAIDITATEKEKIFSEIKESKIEVAFIALHGALGEDGTIQSILENARIPYTGSGVAASRLAINKVLTQKCLQEKGVPVPPFLIVRKEDLGSIENKIKGFPVFVKPSSQGSSIGISLVEGPGGLKAALGEAFKYDEEVLVDRYIEGKELTVGILDQNVLPVIEIRPTHKFFDFSAKYQSGMTDYIIPAEITSDVAKCVQEIALKAHLALGCLDMSRVDVMLDKKNNPFVLEINTIPGFTTTSLLPKAAKAAGMNFSELCLKLVELAYRKTKHPQVSLA